MAEPPRAFGLSFGQRIEMLLELFDSRADASKTAGVNPNQLAKYVKGDADAAFATLQRLTDAKGVSMDWLAGRGSEMFGSGSSDEYIEIAYLEGGVSSGLGRYGMDADEIKTYLKFNRAWVDRDLRSPVNKLFLTRNFGTSNEPDVKDRDMILIDTAVERIVDDAFYVIGREGGRLLKMVERRVDGGIALRSRNPDWKDEILTLEEAERLHIFGRMRWHGGMD